MNDSEINKEILQLLENQFEHPDEINGCPVCSILMDFEFKFISKIQYSITKDKTYREEIAAEGGFCDFHFRQFKKIANGKTNISLLKTIIESGSYKNKNFVIDCRICKEVDNYEEEAIQSFLVFLNDNDAKSKFEKSNGICFDHLRMLTKLIPDLETLEWFYNTHFNQISSLQSDFDAMNKIKSYYEIDRDKRKLINILIEKLAGRKTRSL